MNLSNAQILLLFLGMLVVTYLPRALPLTILSKVDLSPFILKVLQYIPVAILGALLLPSVLMPNGTLDISLSNHNLLAAIITGIVAFTTKKLFPTIICGVVCMLLLNCFM